jgi:Na+/proline symporter
VTDQAIILTGVAIYMLAMLAIGIHASKRMASAADFMVAGRSLPLWLCTGTVMATWLGGGSMMGVGGQAYRGGTLAVIADPFGAALGLILVGLLVVRLLRRLRLLTVIDFFEMRFGKGAAVFAALGMASSSIGWAGALMVAFGFVLNSLTGLSLESGIILGGAVVLIYTTAGGMWAVALTDIVQLAIIIVGLIILFSIVVLSMGGWTAAWADVQSEKLRMIPHENDTETWFNYLRAWLVIGMMPVMLGILASVAMPGLEDQETIIPMLAMEYLHPVFMAVFVGALLAAIMSSADSALLSASSVISNNILPAIWPGFSDRQRLTWARITIPLAGIIAAVVALKVQAIYDLILASNEVLLAGVVVPFILGIWWRASNRTGAVAAMIVGVYTWLLSSWLWPSWAGDLVGMLACLLTMLVVTPLTQQIDPPRTLHTVDGQAVALRDRLGFFQKRES